MEPQPWGRAVLDLVSVVAQWLFGWFFHSIGRAVTRVFGVGRTQNGTVEAIIGFGIVLAILVLLPKLPAKAWSLGLAVMR